VTTTFIYRCLRATAVLAALGFLFGATYRGLPFGLALLVGAGWGILNLLLLTKLLEGVVSRSLPGEGGASTRRLVLLALVKFPLLYGGGWLLLKATDLPPGGLVAGFTLLLAVVLLRVLGARTALRVAGGAEAR